MQPQRLDLRLQAVELRAHVRELAPERVRPFEKIPRGLALPGEQSRIEMVGVLPDPLLAGDRSTLLGGDDLLLGRVDLGQERGKPGVLRLLLLPPKPGRKALPSKTASFTITRLKIRVTTAH